MAFSPQSLWYACLSDDVSLRSVLLRSLMIPRRAGSCYVLVFALVRDVSFTLFPSVSLQDASGFSSYLENHSNIVSCPILRVCVGMNPFLTLDVYLYNCLWGAFFVMFLTFSFIILFSLENRISLFPSYFLYQSARAFNLHHSLFFTQLDTLFVVIVLTRPRHFFLSPSIKFIN